MTADIVVDSGTISVDETKVVSEVFAPAEVFIFVGGIENSSVSMS